MNRETGQRAGNPTGAGPHSRAAEDAELDPGRPGLGRQPVDTEPLARAQGVGPRAYWLGKASPRYREQDVLAWLERNAA